MVKGKDFYFGAEEVRKRWEALLQHREELLKQETKDAEDANDEELAAYLITKGYEVVKPNGVVPYEDDEEIPDLDDVINKAIGPL